MQLHTPRLLLRELTLEDAEAAQRYERDPEVVRYQANDVRSLEESQRYIQSSIAAAAELPRSVFDLAACSRATGAYLGRVGLAIKSRKHLEGMLWYVIDPAHQGQGFVTEACEALLELAFTELGLHRVYIDCDPRNLPALRVGERLGMQHEGRLRENFWNKGEWTDSVIMALLEHEWRARRTGS